MDALGGRHPPCKLFSDNKLPAPRFNGSGLALQDHVRINEPMRQLLQPEPLVLHGLAPEYLRQFGILPLSVSAGTLRVAAANDATPDKDALADLERTFDRPLELLPVDRAELEAGIRAAFAAAESVRELVDGLGDDSTTPPDERQIADARDLASQPPVVRLVNLLIKEAFEAGASDIHLEAIRAGIRVRARVDGVLTAFPGPPKHLAQAVVSRVKLLAELDIAERRIPQDGRLRIRLETRELDLRVSTVPTQFGESVVLRLLDRSDRPASLGDLGMDANALSLVTELGRHAHGLVLATGPTGSGKTTTLYAALALRPQAAEKIITVEDPIEYLLDGITQVPVHAKAGVTFGTALRSILRQDPDVVMIGEMRDRETATIAVQAALTGHLVFSTLHTNDAVSAVVRLLDLGVEPFLVAAVLRGVVAQRLVRRVCAECARPTPVSPPPGVPSRLRENFTPRLGLGCDLCRQSGYRGRTGLFEVLAMDDAIRHAINARSTADHLHAAARKNGFRPLWEDGWDKIAAGTTTVEEVARVLGA